MKRNFWPIGIFGFLFLMVCAVIATVVISIKNTIKEDDSYFSSKKIIDENINEIIKDQNRFTQKYSLYLGVNKSPQVDGYAKLLPVYMAQSNAQNARHIYLENKDNNHIYVKALCKQPQNLTIRIYMEKINTQQKKIDLGEMQYQENKGYFASQSFGNLKEGRYKAIFEVSYLEDNKSKKVFFEREVYAR